MNNVLNIPVFKKDKDSDEHIVAGIVYEPNVADAQGDTASAQEIKKAAHSFMEGAQHFKINHKERATMRILESYIAPIKFAINNITIKKGSWVLTLRVLDESVWEKVKDGTFTGFSMAGSAKEAEEEVSKNTEDEDTEDAERILRNYIRRAEAFIKAAAPTILSDAVQYLQLLEQVKQIDKRIKVSEKITRGRTSIEGQESEESEKDSALWPSLAID